MKIHGSESLKKQHRNGDFQIKSLERRNSTSPLTWASACASWREPKPSYECFFLPLFKLSSYIFKSSGSLGSSLQFRTVRSLLYFTVYCTSRLQHHFSYTALSPIKTLVSRLIKVAVLHPCTWGKALFEHKQTFFWVSMSKTRHSWSSKVASVIELSPWRPLEWYWSAQVGIALWMAYLLMAWNGC